MLPPDPNKSYPKETETASVIRFQDCDPLGHLNNAKYFDYFFNAREDQVSKIYGYNPGEISNGLAVPGWFTITTSPISARCNMANW